MKKAMIYAYTANNLGDDLFIHILCTRYPKTEFLLYAPKKYEQTFAYLTNLHIIPSDRFMNRVLQRVFSFRKRIAKRCDVAIYIGGSLFSEGSQWKKEAQNVQSMIMSGNPFFIIGANFGLFEGDDFYKTYEAIFRACEDVCFRDYYSLKLFQHLPNVRQAADVVFGFRPESSRGTHTTEPTIVISVIYPSIRQALATYDENYFQAIRNIAIQCIENGYKVTLMSFCREEKDHLAVEKILSLIPEKYGAQIYSYFYDTNITEALRQIANAKGIIATRFHAMILGWVYEKPVFPVVYSNKMKTVIEDCGFEGDYCNLSESHKVRPEKVLQALQVEPFNIDAQRQDAVQQFAKLDEIFALSGQSPTFPS